MAAFLFIAAQCPWHINDIMAQIRHSFSFLCIHHHWSCISRHSLNEICVYETLSSIQKLSLEVIESVFIQTICGGQKTERNGNGPYAKATMTLLTYSTVLPTNSVSSLILFLLQEDCYLAYAYTVSQHCFRVCFMKIAQGHLHVKEVLWTIKVDRDFHRSLFHSLGLSGGPLTCITFLLATAGTCVSVSKLFYAGIPQK